jgi:hypothetical protein
MVLLMGFEWMRMHSPNWCCQDIHCVALETPRKDSNSSDRTIAAFTSHPARYYASVARVAVVFSCFAGDRAHSKETT